MLRRSFHFALPLALIWSAPVFAAAQKPVAVSQLVKQVTIPFQQFTLKNGLRVIVHTDRKAPIVAVSVWYDVGSKHEPKGKSGFAHLFEHLMFGGSENVAEFDSAVIAMGGGNNNGSTWFDRTNYFVTVPTSALERMLFIESDRMGHLLGAVTQEKLDAQRGVVQNEKRQGDNQPYGLTEYAQTAALFSPDHPYGHTTIGSMADLDAASLDDVRGWFRQHYGPNNAVLVLAGDIDLKTARAMVEKQFGDIPAGPKQLPIAVSIPTLPANKYEVIKDRVATTRIYREWVVPGEDDPEYAPLSVGLAVLGGLSSSRMDNAMVRGDKTAVAVTAGTQGYAQLGIAELTVDVTPGVDPAVAGKRLDALVAELLDKGPSADEVNRVVTRELSSRIGGLEEVGGFGGKAVTLAEGALYAGDPANYRKQLAALTKVTPATAKAALRKWLMRPVYQLTVEPGERAPYDNAAFVKKPPVPAAPIQMVKRPPIPEVGGSPPLDFPAIERAKLANGIEVYFARRAAVPKVNVSVSFDAGYAADPHDALGTQSFMLSVMDEGTATRSSVQIAEEEERLGAGIGSGASLDRTNFNLSALSANLAPSLDLLTDIIRNPGFAPAEVDRVRKQQLTRISSELTQPAALASRIMPAKLYGLNHPYGIPASGTGDPAAVKALTPDQLRAFHRRWLRPDNARIFVVGDTTLAALKPLLEKSFGTWPSDRMARPVKDFSVPIPVPQPKIYLIDRPNSPQSVIAAAEVLNGTGRDDLVALRASNEILGGGFLSRLNADLREEKGWAYGVRSGIVENENRISFSFRAPVQADKTGDSIRVFRQHLTDYFGAKGVTAEELSRTVNSNVRELPGEFETSGDVLGGMVSIINLGRPDNWYNKLGEKYSALTAPVLDATGRAKIDPAKLIYVVVGDAKLVRPQLDGIGLPVEELPAPVADKDADQEEGE
jgi:zinc protease